MRPWVAVRWARSMMTGAACTRLVVNTPAAVLGCSLHTMTRSSVPLCLRPQATAAEENPGASANRARTCSETSVTRNLGGARGRRALYRPRSLGVERIPRQLETLQRVLEGALHAERASRVGLRREARRSEVARHGILHRLMRLFPGRLVARADVEPVALGRRVQPCRARGFVTLGQP